MKKHFIYAIFLASLTSAAALGYYWGSPADVDALTASTRQHRLVAELQEEFPSLPELRGSYKVVDDEKTVVQMPPTRKDALDWFERALWHVYDEAFEEGKSAGSKLQSDKAEELIALSAEAQRMADDQGKALRTAAGAEEAAQAASQFIQSEWHRRYGAELELSPNVFLANKVAKTTNPLPKSKRTFEVVQLGRGLEEAIELASNSAQKGTQIVLINRSP